jgi:hypothetical protein
VSLPNRLLGANPSIQVSALLSGSLSTPSAKQQFVDSSFDSIASNRLLSATNSITFTSIPSTFQHLQVRMATRGTAVSNVLLRFNGDTASNYWWHEMWTDGGGVTAGGTQSVSTSGTATTHIKTGYHGRISSDFRGLGVFNIMDYANTSKNKVAHGLTGFNSNYTSTGTDYVLHRSGVWLNTSAITSITFYTDNGNLDTGTIISLYGIKSS